MAPSYHELTDQQKRTCPLCGQPNHCVPSNCGHAETPCWCTGVTFHPASLAMVPPEWRHVVCLCKQCALSPPANAQPSAQG